MCLRYVGTFDDDYCKFTIEFAGERILNIGQHLANLDSQCTQLYLKNV